jgi:hypothetical protein
MAGPTKHALILFAVQGPPPTQSHFSPPPVSANTTPPILQTTFPTWSIVSGHMNLQKTLVSADIGIRRTFGFRTQETMGYKLKHPHRWQKKYEATAEEQEHLSGLFDRSPLWHEHANRRLQRLRTKLGYDHANLQTSEDWLKAFQQMLLKDEWWSERRGILKLKTFNSRRSGLALLALYLYAQHARIQFLNPMKENIRPDAASPYEELEGNRHNLEHLLLRTICYLCGHRDGTHGIERGWPSSWMPGAALRYLKPVPDVAPNTVMRWTRAAEAAGGVVPRGTERLRMTWKTTDSPAWKQLQERSWRYFPDAWRSIWRRSKALFLLICAIDVYGAYYSVRWVLRLLHF